MNISLYSYNSSNLFYKQQIERRLSLTFYDFLSENRLTLDEKTKRLVKNSSEDYQHIRIYHSTALLVKKILQGELDCLIKEIKPYSLPFRLNLNKPKTTK